MKIDLNSGWMNAVTKLIKELEATQARVAQLETLLTETGSSTKGATKKAEKAIEAQKDATE